MFTDPWNYQRIEKSSYSGWYYMNHYSIGSSIFTETHTKPPVSFRLTQCLVYEKFKLDIKSKDAFACQVYKPFVSTYLMMFIITSRRAY